MLAIPVGMAEGVSGGAEVTWQVAFVAGATWQGRIGLGRWHLWLVATWQVDDIPLEW